jgi:negative regulator of flagellin synthesis FlgM
VFSSRAQEIIRAKTAVDSAPDVREDLVKSLKDKIDSGQYQVSSDDIAEMMLPRQSADTYN